MPKLSKVPVVRQLCALMRAHSVTRCVLCPGSRNAAIVCSLSSMQEMECRAVTDERSAAFCALGWAAQAHAPVAVCVSSGSALLNLHPAVAEACYRQIPLLIISADRPAAWIGHQDGQTLPQCPVFGSLVRFATSLPEGEDEMGIWHRNTLINKALMELRRHGGGPVHLNIPLREPLFGQDNSPLADQRVIRRLEMACMTHSDEEAILQAVDALPKRMLLLGQHAMRPELPESLAEKGFVVVGEHLSNAGDLAQVQPDLVLGPHPSADLAPDLLISMGGCIVSKRLKQFLRQNPPARHWHLSRDGEAVDTFASLTHCIEGDPGEFWDLIDAFADEGDLDFAERWMRPVSHFEAGYCGMSLVGGLMSALPEPAVLHLANSSAVRYAQLYSLSPAVQVECNRGVNGIEGSLSTAIGYAAGDKRLNALIIGDLSFFYDMNALWQADLPANLRILLLNNGEGGIFETLPGLQDNAYVKGCHQAQAAAWAQCNGLRYLPVRNTEDWEAALPLLLDPQSKQAVLLEAFTDGKEDAAILADFYSKH